jgi:hypothetical protein
MSIDEGITVIIKDAGTKEATVCPMTGNSVAADSPKESPCYVCNYRRDWTNRSKFYTKADSIYARCSYKEESPLLANVDDLSDEKKDELAKEVLLRRQLSPTTFYCGCCGFVRECSKGPESMCKRHPWKQQ